MQRVFIVFFILLFSFKTFAVLQPGTPAVLTAVNAADFKLRGFCNPGGGDVSITFGSLSLSAPCNGILGAYNFEGDVSAETTTNPIAHCVTQLPATTVCSKAVDNQLAPQGVAFSVTPLPAITADNVTSYTIAGTCAPIGTAVTVNLASGAQIINGFCVTDNKFFLTADVSIVPDGVGLSATVTAGGPSLDSTTVDKSSGAGVPNPVVLNVTTAFTDGDADTWLEVGDGMSFSVQLSEPVNVSGTVTLDIAMNSGLKSVSLTAGAGTDILVFSTLILANDEQCDGDISILGVNVSSGAVTSVATSLEASFLALPSEVFVEKIDAESPTFEFGIDLTGTVATPTSSVEFTGQALRGQDNCTADNLLEGSIGTTSGGSELFAFAPIPATGDTYTFVDGVDGFSVNLVSGVNYYVSLRVFDDAGNLSAVNSSAAWTLNPIFVIPDLIVHLDLRDPDSLFDLGGNDANDPGFDGFIQNIIDISGSAANHDFTAVSAAQRPAYDAVTTSLQFDGVDDSMITPNHPDINTATVTQRSFSSVFTTGTNVVTRQFIFEEGGGVRGMNLYVDNNNVYCGFWNNRNDGDGVQVFVSQSTPVSPSTTYNVTSVFDYTNYTGATGPDGTFDCYINGVSMGPSIPITSRLFGHIGNVSLGRNGDGALVHTGADGARRYFTGSLSEFVMFNSPPDAALVFDLNTFFQGKWGY